MGRGEVGRGVGGKGGRVRLKRQGSMDKGGGDEEMGEGGG